MSNTPITDENDPKYHEVTNIFQIKGIESAHNSLYGHLLILPMMSERTFVKCLDEELTRLRQSMIEEYAIQKLMALREEKDGD